MVTWSGQLDTNRHLPTKIQKQIQDKEKYINANNLEIPHKKLQKRTSSEMKTQLNTNRQ